MTKHRGIKGVPLHVLRDWVWRLEVYEGDFIKLPKKALKAEIKRRGHPV